MKSVKIRIPAKVNLTLDVTGKDGDYHTLKSLVASVSVYDEGYFVKRNDKNLTVAFSGYGLDISSEKSNAYKAGVKFIEKFGTCGADIVINRNIPQGGGLGGSSADIVCVLLGLKRLYGVKEGVMDLAGELGSDTLFMMNYGGFGVIEGRGNIISKLDVSTDLYFILVRGEKGVDSKSSYKKYDEICSRSTFWTDGAVRFLKNGDLDGLFNTLKNDLLPASVWLNPEIADNLNLIKEFGTASMTGSGSTVFAVYKTAKERDSAFKKLLPFFGDKLVKAKTVKV